MCDWCVLSIHLILEMHGTTNRQFLACFDQVLTLTSHCTTGTCLRHFRIDSGAGLTERLCEAPCHSSNFCRHVSFVRCSHAVVHDLNDILFPTEQSLQFQFGILELLDVSG